MIFLRVFHFVFLQYLYISLINKNHVLLYICVCGCIYDTFLLYYWISAISLWISLLYPRSHFFPKTIRISGIRAGCSWSFFSACPRRGPSTTSWVSSLSLLRKISLAHPIKPPWRKKIKTTEQKILSICCLSKLSRDRGTKWWIIFPTFFNFSQ